MNIDTINPIENNGWDQLISEHPGATIFHTSAWAKVLQQTYRYKPLYLIIKDNSEPVAAIPMFEVSSFLTGIRGISIPFTDYAEPLIFPNTDPSKLYRFLMDHLKKQIWKYIEFRDGQSLHQEMIPAETFINHTLLLDKTDEDLLKSFHKNHKRNIKKAEKSDLEIEQSSEYQALKDFTRLNNITRRDHGLPPQPFGFFQNLYETIIQKEKGFFVQARLNGQIVASCVYLTYKDKAVYKYGASEKQFSNLGTNQLVMWHAIRNLNSSGFSQLCFGRTNAKNEGLLRFKSGWGTVEKTINYFHFSTKENRFIVSEAKQFGFHNKIFNKMPMPLLVLTGKWLYRHIA